jgi:elongation factor Ts
MELAAASFQDYFSLKDLPKELYEAEVLKVSQSEEILSTPEEKKQARIKELVEEKLEPLTTLGQPSLRDSTMSLQKLIKSHIALLGENIQIGRFSKFTLGDRSFS